MGLQPSKKMLWSPAEGPEGSMMELMEFFNRLTPSKHSGE
jgi:hypothetical protein